MKTENTKIDVTDDYDLAALEPVVLGDLTEKQYKALEDVGRLSPGYHFTVVRYSGGPSSTATHVKIWSDANDRDYVGLVGKDCAQYYDMNKETEKVVLRVSHRVYRRSLPSGNSRRHRR
jgi:hypothetical protein